MCIKPFYSPFKSLATKRLEALIKQHDGYVNLESLRVIQKGIMTWLQERHSSSSRTKLIMDFRKKIEQNIAALEAQDAMPACMDSPYITKPFKEFLLFIQKKDASTTTKLLFDQCQQRFNSIFLLLKTIDGERAIETSPLTDRAIFFENCYVIHHNIATLIKHYRLLLTTTEYQSVCAMQNQLSVWMNKIDTLKHQAFDDLPHSSERFKCDMAYKIRNKFFSVICFPCIDYFMELESLFNMTLDIIGLG